MYKFVIDMMGGDLGCQPLCESILKFSATHQDVEFYCVGKCEELSSLKDIKNIKIIDAREIIKMDESPMAAIKNKEASMIKGFTTFKQIGANAIISCGGTGAYLTGATLLLGRIQGVSRPCLVAPFPTIIKGKKVVILDVGANNKNTPEELVQFAKMGKLYDELIFKVENPKTYLLSNGTEDHKGSPVSQEALKILRESNFAGFSGNIEARDVLHGEADVVVADGFTGNILLKSTEGTFKLVSSMLKTGFKSSLKTKIGYLLSKSVVNNISETFDYKSTGGAMLLGVKGIVVKAHGNSDERGFTGALNVAYGLTLGDIANKISVELNK